MSFTDDFMSELDKKKKKKKKNSSSTSGTSATGGKSYSEKFMDALDDDISPLPSPTMASIHKYGEDDIAPVKGGDKDSWFKSGGFSDGVDSVGDFFGDLGQTVLGTAGDLAWDVAKGAGRMVEGLVDLGTYGVAGVADKLGADEFAEKARDVAKYSATDEWTKDITDFVDRYSVLGNKADMIGEGLGQVGTIILTGGVAASAGLGAGGVAAVTTGATGLSSMGTGIGEAYNSGATDEEAFWYGLGSGAIEAGTELLFGGLGKSVQALGISRGIGGLDEIFAKKLSSKIAGSIANESVQKLLGNTIEFGVKSAGEGLEEVLSGFGSAVMKKLTYMEDEELSKLVKDENLLEQFVVGTITSSIVQGGDFVKATKSGTDFVTGHTAADEKVINKVVEEEVAKREAAGEKLTTKDKNKIYDSVVDLMEKGQIDIDTIESVLGGDTYKAYKETVDSEDALKNELAELRKMKSGDMNDLQTSRMNELKEMNLDDTTKRDGLRKNLDDVLSPMLKDSKLSESYRERERRGQAFEADLSKYTGKQREAVERAVKSGVLNNTYRSHQLVELLSEIEAEKGITFNYSDNKRLKEAGYTYDGYVTNGFADKKTATVTLNVQSSKAWQSVVGHEITHVLETNPDAYNALRESLYAYAESRGELESKRAETIKLYEGKGADIEAELTADLVGDYLFTDKDFVSKLTGNRTLFQKIYDEIKYLWNVATGKEKTEIEKVKAEFDRVWKEYSNNNETIEESSESREYGDAGLDKFGFDEKGQVKDTDVQILDGGTAVKYSLSTWTPETQDKVRNNLVKAGYETERVDKWIDDLNGVASVIAADKDRLDFEAADNQVMLKNNQEYIKTLDASTLCAKRLAYQGTFDAIQHRLPNTVLTSDDLIELQNMLKEHGYEAPCSVCYVESRRRHLGKFAQEWLDGYEGEYKPNLDEVTTSDGLEKLRHSQPQTYKDFVDAMNAKGSANPKVVQLRTEYRNDIMKLTKKQVEKIEAIGGLRVQSFSDFETPHLLDMMQAVMDMSAKGLTSQAYTKVPNFAWVFGDTGIKINLSLIAEGNGFDSDGNLAFSSVEGMDINEAMAVRDAYSENVGTIIVGANDAHILACMADDRIDYIIPFHRSGWGKNEMDMMGLGSYEDYSYGQNEHDIETGKKVANLYPPDYWDYNVSGKENAERYLKLCAQTGREPKFSNFLVNNGDGSYSLQPDGSTDGYWKTLIDFKMYDNEGNGAKQRKVQPNFNMEEAYRILNEYEGGANSLPVANDVVEKFVAMHTDDIAPTPDVQYSISAETDAEYMSAVERGDTETAQMMVDEAAKNAGYTRTLYHGTASKFNVFGFGRTGIFTTNNFDMAKTYGNNVMSLYGKEGANVLHIDAKESPHWAIEVSKDVLDFSEYPLMRGKERYSTNDISLIAFREGYDVVVIDNVYDNYSAASGNTENGLGTDVVYKDSNQVKSSEPVTYDDNGNVIPLSQRFNAENEDIRYSLSKEGEEYAPVGTPFRELALNKDIESVFGNIAPVGEGVAPAQKAPSLADIPVLPDDELETGTYEAIKPGTQKSEKVNGESHIAQVLVEEPKTEKRKQNIVSKAIANFIDKGAAVENLSLKTKNRALQDTYKAIGRSDTKAQYFMENGTNGIKSLNDIRAAVEKTGRVKDFYNYIYHKHNIDRMSLESKERPNLERLTGEMEKLKLLNLQENQLRAIANEKPSNPKRAELVKTVRDYLASKDVKNKPVFDYSVTAEMSQELVNEFEAKNPDFKEYAQDVYDYMNHLRKMMVYNGIISPETAELWAEMYPYYVPIRRVGHKGEGINVLLDTNRTGINAPIKGATGGNSDILPLFETMAQRTMQTFRAIDKNRFGIELKDTLGGVTESVATNLDEVIESVDAQEDLLQPGTNGNAPTFTVFEGGERVTFDITDELYDALKPTSEGLMYTNKVLNTASNVHRDLLTQYNLPFAITNAIKDAQDVLINSQHPAKTYANFPVAVKELLANGGWYEEYMRNGGGDNTYFDKQTNTFTKEKSAVRKIVGFPLDKIGELNNFIEKVPRLAEYIASRKNGASEDAAMLDAARVTTDFSAGGDVTKFLNRNGATFLNASVQGFAQQVRNVREAKMNGLKGWLGLAAKYAIAGLPALLLNGLLWDDDEDYEELSDYVKESYYVVAKYGDGKFVRIPKGRTLAVIQNGFEQISNSLTGDDEADFGRFFELFLSNLAPNNPLDNNIIAPIKQVIENKTWYGDDLVPARLQDLPAAEQFDESTDAISKWLGENLNVSPYKINYLLNQYSGGIGDIFLPMLTPEAESGDNSFLGNMIAPLKDKFTTDSVMNNRNVSDFYDASDELAKNANSSYATEDDVLKSKYMNSVKAEISNLYKAKREIQNSNLSDKLKYQQVREIQKQINELAKSGLDSYEGVNVDGNHATVGDRHYKLNGDGEWQKISEEQVQKQMPFAKVYGGYSLYITYASDLNDIHADKDASGKSINGSRKEKVLNYINNLDADYYTKIILWKSEYPSDDNYNREIVDYINNRSDLSYEDKVAVLAELGFRVTADGQIYSD